MASHAAASDEPYRKLALSVGFLSITVSALVAHASPATGYELSIYTMTPSLVWVGLALAMSVSLSVAFAPTSDDGSWSRSSALVLGGTAMTVLAGLPIIRGYHFFGHHDAMTHLGWARGIADGSISPFSLLYPGIHTLSVFINSIVGIPIRHALLLVVLLSTLAFVVFVPLSVATLVPDSLAVAIATFGAFLLLPVTSVSTFMHPHAMTQTILLFALFVFVLLKYVTAEEGRSMGIPFLVAIVAVAAVVYHPQYVAHMLVVCLAICALQFFVPRIPLVSRRTTVRRIADHQRLYGLTLFVFGIFLLWSANHGFFSGFAGRAVSSAVEYLLTGSGEAGTSIAAQGGSLSAIGASLTEAFLKLFFPHLVVTLLAMAVITTAFLAGRPARFPDVAATTVYLATGLAGLTGLFVVYFVSVTSEMYFRVFGLMMVFAVILASIALHESIRSLSAVISPSAVRTVAVAFFAILIVTSTAALFASPYTYGQSHHVSETQMHGYETAFANADDGIEFAGFGRAPDRFSDAIFAAETRTSTHATVTPETFEDGPADYYGTDRYLVVSQVDRDRELVAYQGLHYSEHDFDSLDNHRNLDRVHSNGEVTTYRVTTDA
ncbi:MFS transporter [Natrarchaeobius chitinivorans]|uniref:MFS transporter n=1 Tax=Natrarchaeobius chitinivorans TaxID=1679083 RepID=A0A3N6MM96_NATCH|nr:MFS transporter [Natrarchaeobius chitinivorans]RQG97181.1 MFS transporter [Natrarchaeobius chitinivorans]